MRKVLCGLVLASVIIVAQGCQGSLCHPNPCPACPWEYSCHNLLHSAAASNEDVATHSYVQDALRCSCSNRPYAECRCQHRLGIDGGDCTCDRVDRFDQRCRCDWRAPYCLCGYYE